MPKTGRRRVPPRADPWRRLLRAVVILASVAGTVIACADPAGAASATCDAEGIGARRCRAIISDALTHLATGRPPITGVAVRLATPEDRTTLRAQQLIAVVTFSFIDGSADDVQVFCQPRDSRAPACVPDGG